MTGDLAPKEPAPDVRRARLDDLDAVLDLVESAYRGASSRQGWTTEADLLDGTRTSAGDVAAQILGNSPGGGHDSMPGDGAMLLLVSEGLAGASEAVLGCCHVERRMSTDGHVGYFGMFAIRPYLQAGGLGSRLLTAAEGHARSELAVERLEMTVLAQRTDLIAWYERRGYVATGERRAFPYGEERFGIPRRDDLEMVVLEKDLVDRPDAIEARLRPAGPEDSALLARMLALAAAWDADEPRPEALMFSDPTLAGYLSGWPRRGDIGVVGLVDDAPVGAAWARLRTLEDPGYGYVSSTIPELSIAVDAPWRRHGLGRALLRRMIRDLGAEGIEALSLSVADGNPARALYFSLGFTEVGRSGDANVMLLRISPPRAVG